MDTMIHDLKERKLLLIKDSILTKHNSILKAENSAINTMTYELQKSLKFEQMKRKRNGWQRNLFIITTALSIYICTK